MNWYKKAEFEKYIIIPITPLEEEILKEMWSTIEGAFYMDYESMYGYDPDNDVYFDQYAYIIDGHLYLYKGNKQLLEKIVKEMHVDITSVYPELDNGNIPQEKIRAARVLGTKIEEFSGVKCSWTKEEFKNFMKIVKNPNQDDVILDLYNSNDPFYGGDKKKMEDLFEGKKLFDEINQRNKKDNKS